MNFENKHCYFCNNLMVVGRGGLDFKCGNSECYQKYMYCAGYGFRGPYVQFLIGSVIFNYFFTPDNKPKSMSCVAFNTKPSPQAYEINCHLDISLSDVSADTAVQLFERVKNLSSFS